jgi:hypothetical protein
VFSDENVQRYVKGLYPVATLLILVPLVDLSLRVFPPQFGTLQWRFATAGLLLGNMGTILLGLGLLGLIATIVGHRKLLRGLGFVALGLGVVLLALLVLFALDAIQIRRLANPNFKRAVLLSSAGALFNGLLGTISLLFLGRAAVAASRVTRALERRPKVGAKAASPIVVARQQASPEIAARSSASAAEVATPARAPESV